MMVELSVVDSNVRLFSKSSLFSVLSSDVSGQPKLATKARNQGFKTGHYLGVKTALVGPITAGPSELSNVLKVSLQTMIYSLADRGWSQRRIARELGIMSKSPRRVFKRRYTVQSIEDDLSAGPNHIVTETVFVFQRRSSSAPSLLFANARGILTSYRIYR